MHAVQERRITQQIAKTGAELTARTAVAASAHAEHLREERKKEREQQNLDNKLSFNQKAGAVMCTDLQGCTAAAQPC
jgi:hypothetical protein